MIALRELVERKFPGKGTTALGAFFFLRIFCPAICAPEASQSARYHAVLSRPIKATPPPGIATARTSLQPVALTTGVFQTPAAVNC